MNHQADTAIIEQEIAELAAAAREAFGTGLASVVLFGSAAEGRLRAARAARPRRAGGG